MKKILIPFLGAGNYALCNYWIGLHGKTANVRERPAASNPPADTV